MYLGNTLQSHLIDEETQVQSQNMSSIFTILISYRNQNTICFILKWAYVESNIRSGHNFNIFTVCDSFRLCMREDAIYCNGYFTRYHHPLFCANLKLCLTSKLRTKIKLYCLWFKIILKSFMDNLVFENGLFSRLCLPNFR